MKYFSGKTFNEVYSNMMKWMRPGWKIKVFSAMYDGDNYKLSVLVDMTITLNGRKSYERY